MELRQLRYFIAVAERLSFSKAASELHITVPPLSRQIRQLEDEFGVSLFVRDRRHVALTDAGRTLLREGRTIVAQTEHVSDSVRLVKCGETRLLRIGIAPGLSEHMSRVLAKHSKRHPAVELQYAEMFSGMQAKALLDRAIDIAFGRSVADSAHLEAEILFQEKFVVHVSKTSPLARHRSLRIRDIARETLLLPNREFCPGLYDKTLALYAQAGTTPRILHVTLSPGLNGENQLAHVASRKGIFVMPDEALAQARQGGEVVRVPLDEPNAKIDVCVTWRKGETSRAVLEFLESVRTVLQCPLPEPVVAPHVEFAASSSAKSRREFR